MSQFYIEILRTRVALVKNETWKRKILNRENKNAYMFVYAIKMNMWCDVPHMKYDTLWFILSGSHLIKCSENGARSRSAWKLIFPTYSFKQQDQRQFSGNIRIWKWSVTDNEFCRRPAARAHTHVPNIVISIWRPKQKQKKKPQKLFYLAVICGEHRQTYTHAHTLIT